MMNLKLFISVLLVSAVVLIVACGGGDPTQSTPTATPIPLQSPATPTPTPAPPAYTVSGDVLNSSTSYLTGGTVTLEPIGRSTTTDLNFGSYVFTDVPDGDYTVTMSPRCVAYGCYLPKDLLVAGGDVFEFHIAPLPAVLLKGGPPAARQIAPTSTDTLELEGIEFASTSLLLISPNDMQPGESAQVVLAGPVCLRCADLGEVETPVEWSVSPSSGAEIDAETGFLTISDAASIGNTYTVTANVGAFTVSRSISVYSAADNPLVGVWSESETGNVGRLLLTSDGKFAVTINPYGNYQDYWGSYTFDSSAGEIELVAEGWNQVAPGGDGIGTFSIDADDQLSLEGVCLGGWDSPTQSLVENCGHKLQK